MLVAVNFQNVPLPEITGVLDRLSVAGWVWQENRKNWTAVFAKDFGSSKGAEQATQEIRVLMGDYFMEGRGAG
jgi:hypothetical protein